jgi:hypothetical protein
MHHLYLLLTAFFIIAACSCVIAERKSRKWYTDRTLLQLSGAFAALALVSAGVWVWGIV